MMCRDRKHWDLQLFADDAEPNPQENGGAEEQDASGQEEQEPNNQGGPAESKRDVKRYSDAEVDAILNRKFAKWKTEQDKAVADARAEAEKLAKMNSEQKRQYEAEKKDQLIKDQQAEIDRLKQDALRAELSKSAAHIMQDDYQIIATQDMLDFVVGSDAESTKANIAKLVGIIQGDRRSQEEKRARGSTPKSYRNSGEAQMTEIQKRLAKYPGK